MKYIQTALPGMEMTKDERIQKLELLVGLLSEVYYHQDTDRIDRLISELDLDLDYDEAL